MTGIADLDVATLDPQGMLATVLASPEQWSEALARADDAPVPDGRDVTTVVVTGMGGSGIAGDLAVVLANRDGPVPVVPVKGYDLPAWADRSTLVVAVSHSGNTEETRAVFDAAGRRGCRRYAVTSGGALAAACANEAVPMARVPGGGQPRASLPSLATPLLVALERAELLPGSSRMLAGVPGHLAQLVDTWSTDDFAGSAPFALAREWDGAVPVLHGAGPVGGLVALRGKCQVNENAKRPAWWHSYPELDHNEIVGWGGVQDGERFANVVIDAPEDRDAQVGRRVDVTLDVTRTAFTAVTRVDLPGPDVLARVAAGVLLVDVASVLLALLRGVDPTPVEVIEDLKRRIA